MAPQKSNNLVASLSAVVIVLTAYNIELLMANRQLSFLIILLISMLLLLYKLLFKSRPVPVKRIHLAIIPIINTNRANKKTILKTSSLTNPISKTQDPRVAAPILSTKPTQWSLQLLQEMDWKNFQELCAHYYESLGYITKTITAGEGNDIDIYLYTKDKPNKVFGVIKCKSWRKLIGVNLVKALFTAQSDKKAPLAVFFSTTGFSKAAISFCDNKHLKLISGKQLLEQINTLSLETQEQLLKEAVQGDYTSPSCVKCNAKMKRHSNNKQNKQVWRCQHYAYCKTTIYRSTAKEGA